MHRSIEDITSYLSELAAQEKQLEKEFHEALGKLQESRYQALEELKVLVDGEIDIAS